VAATRADRKETSPLSRITSLKTGESVAEQGDGVAGCNTIPQDPSRQSKSRRQIVRFLPVDDGALPKNSKLRATLICLEHETNNK
jgi:hypothetical protein